MKAGSTIALILFAAGTSVAWMSEQSIFNLYGDRAFRPDSTTLCIVTTGGDTLYFIDTEYEMYCDFFEVFHLIDVLPEQDYWVLKIDGYEWGEWQLVNGANGRIDVAISEPNLSPDGTRLLCLNENLDAGFSERGLQIWRIDTDSLALEFNDLSMHWGSVNGEWVNDSTIVFKKLYYDWEARKYYTLPGSIHLGSNGEWMPDDPADWEW